MNLASRLLLPCLLALPLLAVAADVQDFSAAEKLLFKSPHLHNVKPPTTLKYSFRRSGSLEAGFEDGISLVLSAKAGGGCCATHTEFLSAARGLPLPDVPEAEGNPVLLAFLEREVREMQRLTKGSQNHFRKRMRMAVYEGATLRQLTLNFRGKPVAVQEVLIKPFIEDPNRPRYENLAVKEYRFLMSDAVPGGLYGIRTRIAGAEGAAPLQVEEMYLVGAEPVAAKTE
jgi:hypothetical protein